METRDTVSTVPTLADVAAHAGVGIGTVSRVLTGSPNVSPAMRERVLASAGKVGYQRTRRSAAHQDKQLGYVGVVVPFFDSPSVTPRLRGMISRLQPHDLELVLLNVDSLAQARKQLLEIPKQGMLRGLIVLSLPVTDEQAARLLHAPFPTVLADTVNPALPSLKVDDRGGGEMATNHLISLGHTRIGFIGEPTNNPYGSTSSANREIGYRRAMHAAGIAIDPALARYGAHVRSAGRQMGAELMSLSNPPTAIVAASDVQAMGCLEAAEALEIRIPEDLSIVGYDDIEVASTLGITTIRQPLERSGQRAAELIIEALSSGLRPAFVEQMEVELVVRSTTAGLK